MYVCMCVYSIFSAFISLMHPTLFWITICIYILLCVFSSVDLGWKKSSQLRPTELKFSITTALSYMPSSRYLSWSLSLKAFLTLLMYIRFASNNQENSKESLADDKNITSIQSLAKVSVILYFIALSFRFLRMRRLTHSQKYLTLRRYYQ